MLTARVFTSTLRAAARQAAPAYRQSLMRSAVRRSYASSGHAGTAGAEKTSDIPWLISSVGVTVVGVTWLVSTGPSKKADAHHDHHDAPVPDEEKAPAVESPDSSAQESSSSDDNPPTNQLPESGNPNAAQGSPETGRQVPPPSADNSDMATDYEAKKGAQEDYKDMIERKDTRVATSSSDMPSKKAGAEHPREDPQKGEGEGVRKGGPA
ncbi:hypothetical protein F4677DRAFT_415557 [Hypoxylon crocopeplum]|nr:hypothetical protein F4677DRAFT_415557 [Hypoxylon crocopeplum]